MLRAVIHHDALTQQNGHQRISVGVVQPHPLVRAAAAAAFRRVLPGFLAPVRGEVEQVEHHHEGLLAAVYVDQVWKTRSPWRRNTLIACRSSPSTVARKSSLNLVDSDDAHGSVHPIRSRNSSSLASGARETSTNDVSLACRCDSGPMWSAIIEQPSHPWSQSGPNMKC